jgi:CheY-like chemotaxis protein
MLARCVSRGGRQRLPSLPQFGQNVHPAISKSIVLVDDEKSYADLLTKMLEENLACPVNSFTRPLEALKALPPRAPGVIVTDYHMPQIDGLEVHSTGFRTRARCRVRPDFRSRSLFLSGADGAPRRTEGAPAQALRLAQICRRDPPGVAATSYPADATCRLELALIERVSPSPFRACAPEPLRRAGA